MKTLFIVLMVILNQQFQPLLSPDFKINEKISKSEKDEILNAVYATFNQYINTGNFWDKVNSQFDNDKYNEFIKLFAGSAQVVDDISFSKEQIHYSEYIKKIFDNLQDNGVPFRIESAMINSIDIDETGFYVIDISFLKRMYSGLNENGNPVELKNGRTIQLNMRIDLADYLLSDARIQYIQIEKSNRILKLIKNPISYLTRLVKRNN